jgi:16S rRNA (adenine1518-N6/adenine1519-N6)-dimethyltransferase
MAKKHLGQNFLKSKKAIHTMILGSHLSAKDVVIEVGPGKGALTEALVEAGCSVIAYEKDKELIPFLEEMFAEKKNFKLIEDDILNFDSSKYKKYKVVANIPYYITGAILEMFLSAGFPPSEMTLLVQKEVAERVVARDKKESILSISVKAYGIPSILMKVSKHYFSPAPKVDSSILHIDSISKDFFKNFSEESFFKVVKKSFQFKRKNIFNNLKGSFSNASDILDELGIPKTVRAEDLSLEIFALLTQKLK